MKILLIRIKSRNFSNETNITGIYPPLGLAYIASVLRNAGYQVKILDNQIANLPPPAFKKEIKRNSPDIVLFSSMTLLWPELKDAIKVVKSISARIIVGVGGPHLTVYPSESLLNDDIDFGVFGEGEVTILEILRNIERRKGLENIKGCVFRKNGKVIINSSREEIENLDTVPFPAIDLLDYRKYIALSVKGPFFSLVTSRGCPYNCRFCFPGYLGKYRTRSPENIIEEIELYVNKYKIQEIIVFDESFAVETEKAVKICEFINKRKLKFRWDVRTRIDLLNPKILKALKSAGCYRLHLGIESGTQKILDKMNKAITLSAIKDRTKLAKRFGFELRGYFLLAYPGENYRSICETIQFAKILPLDWASFTVVIGLPKTEIYEKALKEGYFYSDYWKEYTKGIILGSKPYFIPEGLLEKDLFALKKKAYLEFYFRPKIIWNLLKETKNVGIFKNFYISLKLLPSICHSMVRV